MSGNQLLDALVEDEADEVVASVAEHVIYVTRHGLSCNNITGNTVGALRKGWDPSLTSKGVETAKKLLEEKLVNVPRPQYVYVSSLIRTWMTAALVYGTDDTPDTPLTLIVSPHLKEKHSTSHSYDLGNKPETPANQLLKWAEFAKENNRKNVQIFFYKTQKALTPSDIYEDKYLTYTPSGIQLFCTEITEATPTLSTLRTSSTEGDVRTIHVVAHSNLMQACVQHLDPAEYVRKKKPRNWFKQNLWTMKLAKKNGCLSIQKYFDGYSESKSEEPNPLCDRDSKITSVPAKQLANTVKSLATLAHQNVNAVNKSVRAAVEPAASSAWSVGNWFRSKFSGGRKARSSSSSFSSSRRKVSRRRKISRRVRRR